MPPQNLQLLMSIQSISEIFQVHVTDIGHIPSAKKSTGGKRNFGRCVGFQGQSLITTARRFKTNAYFCVNFTAVRPPYLITTCVKSNPLR
jgi:hypothetical protein